MSYHTLTLIRTWIHGQFQKHLQKKLGHVNILIKSKGNKLAIFLIVTTIKKDYQPYSRNELNDLEFTFIYELVHTKLIMSSLEIYMEM